MSNVPQDVIDDAVTAGLVSVGDSNRLVSPWIEDTDLSENLMRFIQLRAQRQQGAEPVAENNYVQPVPDHCDRITWRNNYYHLPIKSTPPQANALVAAAYRKAAELIMPKEGGYVSPKLRHLTVAADEVSKLNAEIILNSIPADAEAALRELIADAVAAGADNIEGYDLTNIKPWDDVVNSVLGEGGK
jgi:hypothetical protein